MSLYFFLIFFDCKVLHICPHILWILWYNFTWFFFRLFFFCRLRRVWIYFWIIIFFPFFWFIISIFFEIKKGFEKFFALKGSVAVNGVSLTISGLEKDQFEVCLIPYTLEKTNLGKLQVHNSVNIEIDIIARYLERLLEHKEEESHYFFLQKRGFI